MPWTRAAETLFPWPLSTGSRSSGRAPLVMAVGNRALSGPINIHCDHSDSMLVRDSGVVQGEATTRSSSTASRTRTRWSLLSARPPTLHLETLWIRDVTITTGLVDTFTTPQLMRLIAERRLDPTPFATHRFALSQTEDAYDVFAAAADTHALKIVLTAEPVPMLPEHAEAVHTA